MSGPSPKKPLRPWYRPHASTWVVMVLALVVMTFWNVAGYYENCDIVSSGDEFWAHGWPQTYLRREIVWLDSNGAVVDIRGVVISGSEPRRHDSLTPWLWERAIEFHPAELLLDVAIALASILGLGVVYEVWRRKRQHLLQFHISDLLLGIALISAAFGWAWHAQLEISATEEAAAKLERDLGLLVGHAHGTPEFVWRLLPGGTWKVGDYVDYARTARSTSQPWSSEDVKAIREHSCLKHLDLFDVSLSPDGWDELSKMRSLSTLRIRDDSIGARQMVPGEAGFAALARLPNLRKLMLEVPDMTDDRLHYVGRIKTLEELAIWKARDGAFLDGPGIAHLADLPRLTTLQIGVRRLGDPITTDLGHIRRLRRLRRLTIEQNQLTAQDIEALCQLSDLEHLALMGLTTWNIPNHEKLFASLPRLKSLTFESDPVDESLWRSLPQLRHLEELDVRGYGDEDLKLVCRIRSLRRLHFVAEHLTNGGVAELINLPRLESLQLGSPEVDDRIIDSLIGMRPLRVIDLTCCDRITPAGIQRLAGKRPDLHIEQGRCRQ